jgi:lysophospholipase L1-like esterase
MRRVLTALASVAFTVAGVIAAQPASATPKLVVVLGDSFASGSSMDSGAPARWPALLAARDGFTVRVDAVGGSGFTVDAPNRPGTDFTDQATRINKTGVAPDTVVIMAARNDIHQSAVPTIEAAITKTIQTIRRLAPNATILVIGPVRAEGTVPQIVQVFATREWRATKAQGAAYQDGATQPGPWLVGPGVVGTDDVHPTDAGHRIIADKIEPKLRAVMR